MNIEQNLDMQALSDEECANVCGGRASGLGWHNDIYYAFPEIPLPPDGQSIEL